LSRVATAHYAVSISADSDSRLTLPPVLCRIVGDPLFTFGVAGVALFLPLLAFGRSLGRVIEGAAEQPLRPSARTLEVER